MDRRHAMTPFAYYRPPTMSLAVNQPYWVGAPPALLPNTRPIAADRTTALSLPLPPSQSSLVDLSKKNYFYEYFRSPSVRLDQHDHEKLSDRKKSKPLSRTSDGKKTPRHWHGTQHHMLTMSTGSNSMNDFDRRSSSSPNQPPSSIKQQPFSPPPYHPLTNGFFANHHLHHQHQHHSSHERSTPSPDNDEISPLPNKLAESSSTSNLVPGSAASGVPVSPEEKRRCAVCNDIASGYHYGVWSCEGCKAFFKRSIQGTNEYICPATNTCTIDKHRRKSCQACRLRRCYEVGMTKGTTRRERKYRKKAVSVCKITSTSSTSNAGSKSVGNNQEHGLLVTSALSQPTTGTGSSSASHANNNNNNTNSANAFPSPQLSVNKTTSDPTRIPTTPAEFLSTLSQASRLNLPAKVDTTRPLDDQYFLQLLAKIFDQELVVLINWAKAMPGYTESLTLDQQVTIIEQSWLDTLLLDVIERSLERNDDTLHLAPDLIISRNRDLSSPGLGSICSNLFSILQVFKDPRTTHEEFIALKATTLINSVPTTITSTKSFRLLTNQVYQSIQYSCDSNPSVYHDNYVRHFTLLLQLPHIKMLSSKLIRLFLEMRANDLLPQADLLLEMLDAQDTLDRSQHFLTYNSENNSLTSRTASFSLSLAAAANANLAVSGTPPATVFSTKSESIYPPSTSFNQKQHDATIAATLDPSQGHMSNRTTPSPLLYTSSASSGKRSPSTPPFHFPKHPRTESTSASASSGNVHFPMNNSSY